MKDGESVAWEGSVVLPVYGGIEAEGGDASFPSPFRLSLYKHTASHTEAEQKPITEHTGGEGEERSMVSKEWGGEEMEKNVDRGDKDVDGEWKALDKEEEFDPGTRPPFSIGEIRAAIPKHCWVKSPWRSMSYALRDAAVISGVAAAALYLDSWGVWPLYWLAQGTMFWAIFVLGHDCGHGSFSDSKMLNSVVGHALHSFILVPYHGWRISHRTHHQNHGHVENDESWHPLTEKIYASLERSTWKLRFTFPFPMFAFPVYLLYRSPGKTGSHFSPYSDLFAPHERGDVVTSTVCWTAMALVLVGMTSVVGVITMIKVYWVPYWTFVMWLDLVTYLHHHGHEQKLPWYRGKEWSYLRGALTTIDRDYGWINNIHHDIGTHVIHHLFPQIPHYNLREATEAARPVLGKYYREPKKSGPLPIHLFGSLANSLRKDHFVSDAGDVVYYQTDPHLGGTPEKEPDEHKARCNNAGDLDTLVMGEKNPPIA